MKYMINGKEIPIIAIGTWGWGGGMNGSKVIFGSINEITLLEQAFTSAVNDGFILFDTAAVYGMGESERILSRFSANCSIILSDKYTPGRRFSDKKIDSVLNQSTEIFNGRVPDIYWLHQPKNIEKNLKYMCELFKQKRIGGIGVSNFNLNELKFADKIVKDSGCSLSGVQNHYSLLYRVSERRGVLKWCHDNGVPFFSYMVLEQGALTGWYNYNNPFPMLSRRGMTFTKSRLKKIEPLINNLKEIGERYNVGESDIAIAWAIAKGTIPIVGITKPHQVQSLSRASEIQLKEKEIVQLETFAMDTGIELCGSWEK